MNLSSLGEKFSDCLWMLETKYFQPLGVRGVHFDYLHFPTCGLVASGSCSSCVLSQLGWGTDIFQAGWIYIYSEWKSLQELTGSRVLHVGACKTCRASSVSSPAVRWFLDWTRASHLSSVPSIPSKASLSSLELCSIQHTYCAVSSMWSHGRAGAWALLLVLCPATCPSSAPELEHGGSHHGKTKHKSLLVNGLFLVCLY